MIEWDPQKAQQNLAKHGVSFEEAQSVFDDPLYIIYFDPDHSDDEERYLLVGQSTGGRLLIVSFTENEQGNRIISARRATANERKAYESD
ncbi:MAG: BrnT family toxin [Caldilineaceae bacterium]|nr:BrnT family toxin [Caldilineaceae bacterium]